MAESEKKRRSGRARDESGDKPSEKPATNPDAGEKLHQPWLPLLWVMFPLIAATIYGLATRGH
ncbi:MAG: hypothetical protein HYZ29_19885 [Myxococcales bacterium]|nr:hypothetical protein [Myxococcales bacterium]